MFGNTRSVIVSETDTSRVAMAVFIIKKPPNLIKPRIKTGMFKIKRNIPEGIFNQKFNSVAMPVNPPGENSFGEIKIVTAEEYIKLPSI